MGRSVIECWGSDGSPAVAAGAMTGAKICLTIVYVTEVLAYHYTTTRLGI